MGMFGPPEVSLPELATLSRRLATSLEAGLDLRKVLEREAEGRSGTALRERLATMKDQVASGFSFQDALAATGEYFPRLFRQMAAVGEETGQLPEVLRRLSEHYEEQLVRKREFLKSISGPALQFAAAVFVVGLLIWIMGLIAENLGTEAVDILGLGLVGSRGVLIYAVGWVVALVGGWFALHWFRRGLAAQSTPHKVIVALPVLGPALKTLALARLAWCLQMVFDTGMSLKRSVPLCLEATDHAFYREQAPAVVLAVTNGKPLSEALSSQGGYPNDFLDALEVGEQTGRIPETMGLLSKQYQEKAQAAVAALTKVAAFLVWLGVALFIAFLIVRIFMVAYIDPINKMSGQM